MSGVTAGPPGLLKAINARAVLEVVDRLGPVTRARVRRETGLSKTAVAQTMAELLDRGIVIEAGLDDGTGGPAAVLHRIDRGAAVGAAVDLRGDTVHAAIVDLGEGLLTQASGPSRGTAREVADGVRSVVTEAARAAGLDVDELDRVVIGVPGVVTPEGDIRFAPRLPEGGAGLAAELRARLPWTVDLENDTNLAAVAEQRHGAARGVRDFVLLFDGDDAGAGVVLDGRLHRGGRGSAGEIGLVPGGTAGEDPESRLVRLAAILGLVLDPDLVVLGGPVVAATDPGLPSRVERRLALEHPAAARPVAEGLLGADAVLLGAAEFARDLLREDAFSAAVGG